MKATFEIYKYDIGNDYEKEIMAVTDCIQRATRIQNDLQHGENSLSPYEYRVRKVEEL